jgi:hypothetical protein
MLSLTSAYSLANVIAFTLYTRFSRRSHRIETVGNDNWCAEAFCIIPGQLDVRRVLGSALVGHVFNRHFGAYIGYGKEKSITTKNTLKHPIS